MIPERFRSESGRPNLPVWALAAGGILLILIAFLAWIGVGMGSQPAPEPTTLDVPLAR